MSEDNSLWPPPKFRFSVNLAATLSNVAFQEVLGMETEPEIIEHTKKGEPSSEIKMPHIPRYGNVTMKRGLFVNDNTFWNFYNEITMGTVKKRTILIRLQNESGATTMQWTLNKAWPTKITSTDLKSDGNEVAVDSIEIAYEQLVISKS
jgi:phage tail-like protein